MTTPTAAGADARDRITDERIVIVGLGYVGLPLAISFVEAGCSVLGIDAAPARVAELQAGRSPIDDVDDGRLRAALDAGLSVATTADADPASADVASADGASADVASADVASADVAFVCVPTPITQSKDPDLGPVLAAGRYLGERLRPGQLVILQSTTFPGTTSGPFRQALEDASGLAADRDFDLAFAPERVNPGDPASLRRDVPRLVGGLTPAATARAAALLRRINTTVHELSSPDAAELAKLLENVFRNVNIALVNQLALLCERMGLDVWEVIDAAATKPFGFMPFRPGPGVGGHCIPVDPFYLSWRARQFDFVDRFVEVAGEINLAMPRHVVELAAEALNERGRAVKGARVGVIGVAFKPNVRDPRNSPAADVIALLRERGAEVSFHDPHVDAFRDAAGREDRGRNLDGLIADSDLLVVVTPHAAIDWDAVYAADLVVDTANSSRGRVRRDLQVLRLGAGWARAGS